MANLKHAKKAAKRSEKNRVRNLARKSAIKTTIKKLMVAIEQDTNAEQTKVLFNDAQAQLARAKSKGLIHANTAARKISRLAQRMNQAE